MSGQIEVRSPELEKAVGIFRTAVALADAAEVSDRTISHLRYHRRNIKWQTANRIADAANEKAGRREVSAQKLFNELCEGAA